MKNVILIIIINGAYKIDSNYAHCMYVIKLTFDKLPNNGHFSLLVNRISGF